MYPFQIFFVPIPKSFRTHSRQRTNNISKGEFADDESFCAFAAHAAATKDELQGVDNVEGWFKGHEGIRDLTPLKHTAIDSPLLGLELRYAGNKISVAGNMHIVFSAPTAEQAERLRRWETIINENHIGFEGDQIDTEFDPGKATDPARVRPCVMDSVGRTAAA